MKKLILFLLLPILLGSCAPKVFAHRKEISFPDSSG